MLHDLGRRLGVALDFAVSVFRHDRIVKRAFRDFMPAGGPRAAMFAHATSRARRLRPLFHAWRTTQQGGEALAKTLVHCSAELAGLVGHRDVRFPSYFDVALQVRSLRALVDVLADARVIDTSVSPRDVIALVLAHVPASRAALLAQAELLLDASELDAALDTVERARRIQSACPSAERLLFRVYEAQRRAGSLDPRLAVLDYDLTDKYCPLPFQHFSTGWNGNAHACSCPAWVPYPIGNVVTAPSADAIWNSEVAVEIRRSILDGDFSYCSRTRCSFISAQKLPRKDEVRDPMHRRYIDERLTTLPGGPLYVDLNYDNTCNLACPSCRTGIIGANEAQQETYVRARDRVILPLLKTVRGQAYLSGGGEAFSSPHYRSILSVLNRKDYPGLYLHLITNAQLLTPQKWQSFPDLPEMVGTLSVSIDAATGDTYERLRRPGKWAALMTNLEFIASLRRSGAIKCFWINFVVQRANYREMPGFVELGVRLGVDKIWFQRVTNYGAFDEATFVDVDVTSPAHPEHARLLEILRTPAMQGPLINRQMLMSLMPEVVASDERFEFLY